MASDVSLAAASGPRVRSVRWMAFWAGMCGMAALLSLLVSDARPGQVIIWLANPVGAVALLRLSRAQWPAMVAALILSVAAAHGVHGWLVSPGFLEVHNLMAAVWRTAAYTPVHVFEMLLSTLLLCHIKGLQRAGDHVVTMSKVLLRAGVIPVVAMAPVGGLASVLASGGEWHSVTLNWFVGHTIGTVAALPLALAVSHKRPGVALAQVMEPLALGLMLASVAVTLWAGTSLPKPFVIMAAPVLWMAVRSNLVATLAANALVAASMAALIRHGVLLPPPTSLWWGDALFYLSVLATLLPGLFLVVMSEGQRLALQVLAHNETRARDQYFRTPAMLHSIDAEGRIVQVSKLWLDTLGYTEAEVLGRHVTDFMTPAAARLAKEVVIPQALRDGRCDNIEYQLTTKDGGTCEVILSAIWEYDSGGQPLRSLAVLQDVTEKKRLKARSHFAEHDPLTGLPNRVLMQDRLKMLCAHYHRHQGVFAVGFLDLDHFKDINDNHGHDAGDLLLREVARRLQGSLRAADTVCRLGGDEFVMIFSTVDSLSELHALAAKLMAAISAPCRLGDGEDAPVVQVSGSLGLALFPAHGVDPQVLLTHADQAMYAAKRSGRNRCEVYRDNA